MSDHHSHHQHGTKADDQTDYTVSRLLTGLAVGAVVIGAGVMLAPHILPALGATSADLAEEASLMIHNSPMGMAGAINSALSLIPVIGAKLAEGGLFTAATSALTGVGGVILGQFIESRENGNKSIKWGNVIKYGALITSAFIAMPAILSSLSTGIIYCGMALSQAGIISTAACNNLIANIAQTLGGIGGTYAHNWFGLSGISAIVPHLLCCGAPFLPAVVSFFKGRKNHHVKDDSIMSGGESIDVRITTHGSPEVGKTCHVTLQLDHADGSPLTADELKVVHTEKIHLFVTDSSLRDYQHIHPQPTDKPGKYSFDFVPASANSYSAWADFTTLSDEKNHRIKTEISRGRNISPRIQVNSSATSGNLVFQWDSAQALTSGKSHVINVLVTDEKGASVSDLQPVMGAFAHLVGFSADGKFIIHTHPMGAEPTNTNDRGGPLLQFHVEPDHAGPTQFYLQVRRQGEDIFVPFGQVIAAQQSFAKRHVHIHNPSFSPSI